MSCIMLLLLALPSLGITASVSRASLVSESETQSEEIEECVVLTTLRRANSRRESLETTHDRAKAYPCCRPTCRVVEPRAIVGHRFTNNLRAPIRC